MTSIFIRIASAALLSLASLLVVLFRVSPLAAPAVAVPFFFLTVFLSVASIVTLISYYMWSKISTEGMDAGKKLSASLREGFFIAAATLLVFLFLILQILTWWIAVLIYASFLLLEMALLS